MNLTHASMPYCANSVLIAHRIKQLRNAATNGAEAFLTGGLVYPMPGDRVHARAPVRPQPFRCLGFELGGDLLELLKEKGL